MSEISKAEFKRLMIAGLLEWPPWTSPDEGRVYGVRVESEDNPREFVWYVYS